MGKEEFFSKWNIKDYSNQLEQILETKSFSENVKNLLLSMLYKIENAYKDYEQVKREVPSKNQFLEELLEIIEKQCDSIELIIPNTEKSQEWKRLNKYYEIDRVQKKICVFPNDKTLLKALYAMADGDICFPQTQDFIGKALCLLLTKGNTMNKSEVIRDFNGWSWDISSREIEEKIINLLFQNLMYLLGNEFMEDWLKEDKTLLEKQMKLEVTLKEMYQNDAKAFLESFYKTSVKILAKEDEAEKTEIITALKAKKKQLNLLENKTELLQEITRSKKEITEKIGEIDTLLNDNILLAEEYRKRNKELPNNQKIFSISHLAEKLEKQRQEHLNTIKEYNKIIEPKEYVHRKNQIKEEIAFLEAMEIEENKELKAIDEVIKVQRSFLICMKLRIQRVQTKKEIMNLIYIFRYYQCIIYEEGRQVGALVGLQEMLESTKRDLLKKAYELKVMVELEIGYQLELEFFDLLLHCAIINLENIYTKWIVHKDSLQVEIYDDTILEEEYHFKILSKDSVKMKTNKKIKLFI